MFFSFVCFAEKRSPRLWYALRFGKSYSVNNRIKSQILILSDSVLYSVRVYGFNTSGPTPQMKSSWISCPISVHSVVVMSSHFISGVMSILCSRLVNGRNRSNHCLGVNITLPFEALASRFGTAYFCHGLGLL